MRVVELRGAAILSMAALFSLAPRVSEAQNRAAAAATSTALRLRVDLSQHLLYVERGGERVNTFIVSGGTRRHPTPRGTFRVAKVVWNPPWVPPRADWAKGKTAKPPAHPENPMKTVKIFFKEPDYYIHGTDEVDKLGGPASHGCLRMDAQDAADLARLVMEAGGQPKDESWYQNAITRGETRVVRLPRPVSIVITR